MNPHQKISLGLLLAWLAGGAALAEPETAAVDRLAPMRFLVGFCWQGMFPDGEHSDTHCFEDFYGQAFLRDRHLVRGTRPDYRGESIYQWDPEAGQITYRYWNSLGGVSDGPALPESDRVLFPGERHVREDGSVVEMRSVLIPIDESRYQMTTEQQAGDSWEQLWAIEFSKLGPVTPSGPDQYPHPEPQATALPHLNPAAADTCLPLKDQDFAFTSRSAGNPELFLYSAARQAVVRLTDEPTQDHWASFSPGGERIAFQSLRDGQREVYVMDAGGADVANLSRHPEQDLLPAWSPDGEWIAFFSSRDLPWTGTGALGGHLFVIHPDQSGLRRLEMPAFDSTAAASWSPDGGRILYARYAEGRQGLYVYDLENQRETRLATDAAATLGDPHFSPDGALIALYRQTDQSADIHLMAASGGPMRRISAGSGFHYSPAWSADGRALLITSSADGDSYHIRCLAVDGSYDLAVIDDPADARSAAWRPQAR